MDLRHFSEEDIFFERFSINFWREVLKNIFCVIIYGYRKF